MTDRTVTISAETLLLAIAKAFEAGIEATLAAQAGKPIDGRKLAETDVKQAVAKILEQAALEKPAA